MISYPYHNPESSPPSSSVATVYFVGSVISNVLNMKYPADADAMLLTGFALIFPTNEIGIATQALLLPDDISDPRYAQQSPGYLVFNSRTDFNYLFYYTPETDPNLQNLDYAIRGTFAIGEAATAALPSQNATAYKNPVLIVTGSHDAFFCSFLSLDLEVLTGEPPDCDTSSSGPAAMTQTLYPAAKSFTFMTPDAGHCWHLHENAYASFVAVHQWIRSQGF